MNKWDLTRTTGKDKGIEIKTINFPDNVSLERDAKCPYTINVTCEKQPNSPMADEKWWSEYALEPDVTSVSMTETVGNVTKTTYVCFDESRGKKMKVMNE